MKIGVIVSHRSTSLGFFPKATRDALNSTIARYNHKHKNQVNVEIALDYEGFQDLQNKGQTQSSIKKSMLNLREKYDELIFLLLVDGELGEGQENEYSHIQTINGNLPADKKFHIHALIKWFEGCSDKSYPQLMNKKDETKPVCEWYKDDDNFERLVYEMLDGVASSKSPKAPNFWRNVLIGLISIIALLILIIPNVDKIKDVIFHPKQEVCVAEDSTVTILPITPGTPGGQAQGESNSSTPPDNNPGSRQDEIDEYSHTVPPLTSRRIEDNTYEVTGVESPLRGYLCKSISSAIPNIERPSEGSTERWTISVEQDVSVLEVPKLIESDEFVIDVEYTFSIMDNISGKVIFENTISTRGKSPASKEDAIKHSRQLAAEEIANQIKDIIR